jgi:hypothetical protein
MRAREGEKVGQRGVAHGADISDELGHAPASNAHQRGPYHGKLVRALAARGRAGARRKMEAPVVHCGGQNGNVGERARERWRRRVARLFCCCGEAKGMEEE